MFVARDRALEIELGWLDGLIGVAASDSARAWRAQSALATAPPPAGVLAASLRALWRERRTGAIDSLRALEDRGMAASGLPTFTLPVHRLAIGRSLVRSGDPAGAEAYLQWTDAAAVGIVVPGLQIAFGPYTTYQRAVAADAAGDHRRALLYFQRFVNAIDTPASILAPRVSDARARLARLMDTRGAR